MKGRARRWIGWIALALSILAALLFALLRIFSAPQEAKVAWSYKPPAQLMAPLYFIYPRIPGGCFAVNPAGQLFILDAVGRLIKHESLPHKGRYGKGAVDNLGTLYVGGKQSNVYAYNSSGDKLWECAIPAQSLVKPQPKGGWTIPMLGQDGKLHIELDTGEFAVLSRDGQIERRFDVGMKLSSLVEGPARAPGGGFYLVAWPKDVIRISAEGKVLWRYPTTGYSVHEIASSPDGTVYFVAHQDRFYALNPDGTKRWDYVNPDPTPAGGFHWYWFSVGANGTVYVSSGPHLTAFKPDGTRLWSRKFDGECGSALFRGNRILVQESSVSLKSWLYRELLWIRIRTGSRLPAPTTGGDVQRLYILDASRGRILRSMQLPADAFVICTGADGALYGYRNILANTSLFSDCEILRIDLD